jgi:phosphohistidine phosphatase
VPNEAHAPRAGSAILRRVRLLLVRHAEAAPGDPDAARALTARGREQAGELAARFAAERPAAVLSSPLLRARETAEAIARASGAPVVVDERLGFGATAEGVSAAAREVAAGSQTVVAVAHQPDCGRIAAELTGGPEPDFPTAGVVELELT